MNGLSQHVYEFDEFRLDPGKRRLSKNGSPLVLTPKVFETLLVLVRNSGRVLEKEELLKTIWPDTVVEENNLTQNISALRKALHDSPHETRYILTIPGRGYRFTAEVKEAETSQPPSPAPLPALPDAEIGPVRRSIAVLPFKVFGMHGDDEYFGVGIADALITRLSNIERISVRPTSAVMGFCSMKDDPLAVGRRLGVKSVLEGTIRRFADRIRVTVQLVCMENGEPWWAAKFDEEFTNIFTVEDSISEQVTEALLLKLTGEEQSRIAVRRTASPEAYQAYLMGRYFWNKRTPKGLQKGIEYFEQAICHDPEFTAAYSGLADCYTLLGCYSVAPTRHVHPKAEAAALKALSLDENSSDAHASLGILRLAMWNWPAAFAELARALELNPLHLNARQWRAELLTAHGRLDEAVAEIRRAREADPLCLLLATCEAWIRFYARQYEQAAEVLEKVVEIDPNYAPGRYCLGAVLVQLGRHERAVEEFRDADRLSSGSVGYMLGHTGSCMASLGYTHAVAGNKAEAERMLTELGLLAERAFVPSECLAMVHAGLGDADRLFDLLDRAHAEHSEWLIWLKVDPWLDPFRLDSRFDALLRRVGLE